MKDFSYTVGLRNGVAPFSKQEDTNNTPWGQVGRCCHPIFPNTLTAVYVLEASQHLVKEELVVLWCQIIIGFYHLCK